MLLKVFSGSWWVTKGLDKGKTNIEVRSNQWKKAPWVPQGTKRLFDYICDDVRLYSLH